MSTSPPDLTADLPSFRRLGPAVPRHPVIVAVPHAGRHYPDALLRAARVPMELIAALEDRHADLLAAHTEAAGATIFVADRPRAWIDLNRGEREIDPAMLAPRPPAHATDDNVRVRAGLGLVPRRGPGGIELWRRPLSADEVARRIVVDHRPWHSAIAAALADARARFGVAVLLDLHSMPPLKGRGGSPGAQVVIGDRHGVSAARRYRDRLCRLVRGSGLRVAENVPYAGGHALDRHGRPAHSLHAVQVEIDRALYLAPDLRRPGAGLAAMQALVARMVTALADEALGDGLLDAAE